MGGSTPILTGECGTGIGGVSGIHIDFLQKAGKAGIEQCFVLSTCNRSEVYFFAPEEIAQPLGVIRT